MSYLEVDERIEFYTRGERQLNFGDYLGNYLVDRLCIAPLVEAELYRLIGSVISDELIRNDLGRVGGLTPSIIYWCCGARDDSPLDAALQPACTFMGVRGPLTLKKLNLPDDTPQGDPGFLLPLVHPRPSISQRTLGRTACMPHISQLNDAEGLMQGAGADVWLSPAIESDDDLTALIQDVASCEFLLTASLHGAIVACAYGRPFAFWDNGYIDVPFKWDDISASLSIPSAFSATLTQGQTWYAENGGNIARPRLLPILTCCPFAAKASAVLNAAVFDCALDDGVGGRLIAQAQGGIWESEATCRRIRLQGSQARLDRMGQVDMAAHAARRDAAKQLSVLLSEADKHANRLRAFDLSLSLRLTPASPSLTFSQGALGSAFLDQGWTDPNEVAPWSLPPFADIALPIGCGWEQADAIRISGYLFCPQQPPVNGRRRMVMWVNDTRIIDEIFVNDTSADAIFVTAVLEMPPHIKAQGGRLVLRITTGDIPTQKQMGKAPDDRPIGFAPVDMTLLFE